MLVASLATLTVQLFTISMQLLVLLRNTRQKQKTKIKGEKVMLECN